MTTPESLAKILETSQWGTDPKLRNTDTFNDWVEIAKLAIAECERWEPIESAPKDGRFIELCGDSGYSSTPIRVAICRYVEGYHLPWRNHSNDAFEDGGPSATHWRKAPKPPSP